jgi:hypothetical protein
LCPFVVAREPSWPKTFEHHQMMTKELATSFNTVSGIQHSSSRNHDIGYSTDLLCEMDSSNHRVAPGFAFSINEEFQRLLGYSAREWQIRMQSGNHTAPGRDPFILNDIICE